MSSDPLLGSPSRLPSKVRLPRISKTTLDTLSAVPSNAESRNFIGVKDHLPSFYEKQKFLDCDELDRELGIPQKKTPRRCHQCCCHLLAIGIFLVICGIFSILLGFFLPRKEIVVEKQDSLEVRDRTAIYFNNVLELSILLGVGLACLGGSLASVSLTVLSVFPGGDPSEELDFVIGQHNILFAANDLSEDSGPRSPLEEKIPAVEHLKTVQPDWEKEREAKKDIKLKNGVAFRF